MMIAYRLQLLLGLRQRGLGLLCILQHLLVLVERWRQLGDALALVHTPFQTTSQQNGKRFIASHDRAKISSRTWPLRVPG